MSNMQNAPKLKFDTQKSNKQFYQIPQDVADIVFNELGNSSAQLRIMMVLIGTKEGFGISEAWILQRTGLQKASYIKARKSLVERGWLTHENASFIQVNFNNILKSSTGNMVYTENSNLKSTGNMVYTEEGNMVYTEEGNMVYPITYKETNNLIDNNDDFAGEDTAIEANSITNPMFVEKEWLIERYNDLVCYNTVGVYKYNNKFYKIKEQ